MNLTEPVDDRFLTAKATACRYGFQPISKNGNHGNHTQFLRRLAERHTNFPLARWIGGRKTYKLSELVEFERSLPCATKSEAA